MSWNWDKINKVSIDNLSSHVFTDTIFIDRYTNEVVFMSLIGYNSTINLINKSLSNCKEKINVYVKYSFNKHTAPNKYDTFIRKKDSDFTHLIACVKDKYNFNESVGENFLCYIVCSSNDREELKEKVYQKIDEYSSIPLIREWMDYVLDYLLDNCYLIELDKYSVENDIVAYKLELSRHTMAYIISHGLEIEKISIEGKNEYSYLLEDCNDLNSYLNTFGESLAKKIQNKFRAKFIPSEDEYDKITNIVDDYIHFNANKELFETQKATIQSIVNNWKSSKNTLVVGQMGTGKTIMASSSTFIHHNNIAKGLNCLIMCPSHLVENWKNEVEEIVPNSKCYIIHNITELFKIKNKLKDKARTENMYVIISKETAKNEFKKRPAAIWKESHAVKKPNGKYEKGKGVFICPECGQVLKKTIKIKYPDPFNVNKTIVEQIEVPLDEADFIKELSYNIHCSNKVTKRNPITKELELTTCNAKLWQPLSPCLDSQQWCKLGKHGWVLKDKISNVINILENNEKRYGYENDLLKFLNELVLDENMDEILDRYNCNNFSHKYSLSKYIKDHMKGVFDYLIADEVHQLASGDTEQGIAFHHLVKSCKRTIGLTGTIVNGYVDSIYYILYRLYPSLMKSQGFNYEDKALFTRLYGVTASKSVYKLNSKTGRTKEGVSKPVKVPGISPLVFTKFLLNNTVFVSLEDMKEGLPSYKEIPYPVEMDADLYDKYRNICDQTKELMNTDMSNKAAIVSSLAKLMMTYPDAPHCEYSIFNRRTGNTVYEAPRLEETYRNKERALLDIVEEKLANNEKVLVYYNDTNITNLGNHLVEMFNENNIKSCELKAGNSEKRMNEIEKLLDEGIEVLICNPELVQTGLNLLDFTTIIFYQIGYKLAVTRQASKRSYRLNQTKPVTVYFMYYEGTAQEVALYLMANKIVASESIEGKFSNENGINSLGTSQNILIEIANNVCNNIKNTVDASLFKSHEYTKKAANNERLHNEIPSCLELNLDDKGRIQIDSIFLDEVKNNKIDTKFLKTVINN